MNRWSPYLLSILRIIAAFVYMVHGTQKLFGFPAPFPMPHLPPLFMAGGIIETFGGLLLLLGLFTRPVADALTLLILIVVPRLPLPGGLPDAAIASWIHQSAPGRLVFARGLCAPPAALEIRSSASLRPPLAVRTA
jgi:hypothetical protein